MSASGERPGVWGTVGESAAIALPPRNAAAEEGGGRGRTGLAPGLASLGLAVVFLSVVLLYLKLPYRSSWIRETTFGQVSGVPSPDFRLGSIEWSVSTYRVAPALEPFRRAFREQCKEKRGLEAALCVSDAMARQFPYGRPLTEFTDSTFDPVTHLQRHAAGEPGHCMNRVAIMAAELLSVGIPARVTQLLPSQGPGHNVVEIWDEPNGWVVVDPTYGTVLGDGQRPAAAALVRLAPEHVPWYSLALAPAATPSFEDGRRNGPDTRLYRGRLLYPEPWLYLRVGTRSAPWPFRGAFACLGDNPGECGGTHDLLRLGALASGLGSVGFLVGAFRARAGRPGSPPY